MPDIREVNTATGGKMYVDFDLLNPAAKEKAMQYTPQMMSVAPEPPEPAPYDASGMMMSAAPQPEALQSTEPLPPPQAPQPETISSTPYSQSQGDPMWRGAPDPAAMMAPQEQAQPPVQQAPQEVPPDTQVVEDQMPSMGVALVKGRGGGGASPSRKTILGAMEAEKAATQAGYDAQAQGAAKTADVYDEALQKIEARDAEIEQRRIQSEAAFADSIKKHDQAIEEVRSMKIDPDHYLNSKSTGQKIMMGLAIGLKGGDDKFLQSAINRDIEAQSAGIKTKMEYVNNLKISADMKREMLNDLERQRSMRSAQVLEAAKLKIESVMSRTQSETAQSEGNKVLAQLTQRQEAIKQKMAAQDAARAADKVQPWIMTPGGPLPVTTAQYLEHMHKMGDGGLTASERLQREKFEYEKSKDQKAMSVPGYEGQAQSAEDAKRFRDALPTYEATIRAIDDMAKFAKGTNFLQRGASHVPGFYTDLKTKSKQISSFAGALYKGLPQIAFGALSEGDKAMVNDFLTDPLSFAQKGGDIERAKKTVQNLVSNHAKSIGLRASNAVTEGFRAE